MPADLQVTPQLYFLAPTPLTWACVILASACSTVLMAALLAGFDVWRLPALTAPFVFTSLVFFLSAARFGRLASTGQLPTAGLPVKAAIEGVVTGGTVGEGLLTGIGQVFFQGSALSGALFAAGLLVSSRRACAAALVGSLAGLLIAWGMGAAEPAIRAGAFGFNSVMSLGSARSCNSCHRLWRTSRVRADPRPATGRRCVSERAMAGSCRGRPGRRSRGGSSR